MTGRRNIIIAVSAIVVFAAIVGFFITLDVSPQIAYARLFIDAGLVIGLIAVVMAFYRERSLPTDAVLQGLRSLKNAQFKTRLTSDGGPLTEIITTINELASVLEEQQQKQEEIKRNLREELLPGLKQKEGLPLDHSYHPELGPVLAVTPLKTEKPKDTIYSFRDVMPVPIPAKKPAMSEGPLNNTLIASKPPKDIQKDAHHVGVDKEQDLEELYERFTTAQKSFNIEEIEYSLFLNTIEKTKRDLMNSYKCHSIFFDIVREANQVALQPKIVREPRANVL